MVVRYSFVLAFLCLLILQPLFAIARPIVSGKLHISIENVFDGEPLKLNERVYRTSAGDSIIISNYKYYISNIKLATVAGKEFEVPESYFLVNESRSSSKKFDIELPEGTYSAIRFMIGVDSLHNVSGAQTDALDPINAMFWDWNTGYIMGKLEGRLNNVEQTEYSFHIGGFAGNTSTVRWVTLNFLKPILIKPGADAAIILTSDAAEWLRTPNDIDLHKTPVVATEGADAVRIADNYANMFSLGYVE